MDAIVLLRQDHKTVEKLFKRFETTGDDDHKDRRGIVDMVIEELTVHAWVEERIHPAAREVELGEQLQAAKSDAPRDPLHVPSAE
ncbi:hypothetical protein ACGFYP_03870 [Streptomyces sp. NPDC048370]|uniref:hypothetical protein n=1 Tax=Streptomyces sp. NPDC048370 TaxID=3365540 RepID=UPI00371931E6